jgi:hypothetical protein
MATHVLDPQPQHEHNPPSSSPSTGYKVCKGKRIPHHEANPKTPENLPIQQTPNNCHPAAHTKTLAHIWSSKIPKIHTKHAHPPSQQRRGLQWAAKAGLCCTSTTQSREKSISVSCRGECVQTTWKKYSPAVVVIRTPGRLGVGCRSSSLRQAGSKDHRHGHKPLSSKPKPSLEALEVESKRRENQRQNPIRSDPNPPNQTSDPTSQNRIAVQGNLENHPRRRGGRRRRRVGSSPNLIEFRV